MCDDVLVDLDGVLVNFVKGALAVHGKKLPYAETQWNFFDQIGVEITEFWKPMDFHFWATLEWFPGGQELLEGLISRYGYDRICFCTSPCDTICSVEGKIEWIRRNAPAKLRRNYMITPVKQFAARGSVLIDDRPQNCYDVRDNGGKFVMVPQPWNLRWNGKMYDPRVLLCEVEATVGN